MPRASRAPEAHVPDIPGASPAAPGPRLKKGPSGARESGILWPRFHSPGLRHPGPVCDPRKMNDRHLLKGLFLIAVALAFGLGSFKYQMGHFERAGPGLFPLLVSSVLLAIGVTIVLRSFFIDKVPLYFNLRNIAIILGSLVGFALGSLYINMIVG